MANTVFSPGQCLETLRFKFGKHFLADRAVEHGACVCFVTEQERHVEDLGLGHKVRYRAGGRHGEFLGAQLHRLNGLTLTAQRAAVKSLDFVAAASALFNFSGKGVDAHTLVRVLRHRDADLHGGLGGGCSDQP